MLISKMEHADLVIEMAQVEHLSTQDRLHLARMYVLFMTFHSKYIFLTISIHNLKQFFLNCLTK